jgi:hypothetical protein
MTKKLTSRSRGNDGLNSTLVAQFIGKFDADRPSSESLEDRVRKIEDWIAQQTTQKSKNFVILQKQKHIAKLPRKRGPKTISDAELASRRDDLVRFLESNWPELQVLCVPKLNPVALKEALVAFATVASDDPVARALEGTVDDHRAAARRLVDDFSQLQFLLEKHQNRVAGDPRQIANAMAGSPDMGFWTSLKRCQRLPFRVGIHLRAMRAYIQRKHPRLYKVLSEPHSLPELAAFRSRYRTKDKVLVGFTAVDLERIWVDGIPRLKPSWSS